MIKNLFAKPLNVITRIIVPNICINCSKIISQDQYLCDNCESKLDFAKLQFEKINNSNNYNHLFHEAYFVFNHKGVVRKLITDFKYYNQQYIGPALAKYMAQYGCPIIDKSDYIMPIPLHKWRFIKRGYNQAAILAKEISKRSGKKLLLNTLIRTKKTKAQTFLNYNERKENLKNAFCCVMGAENLLKNKNILLIDDVFTTGATVDCAAQVLLQNGASKVYVLTCSRRYII